MNRALKILPATIALVLALGFGASCRTTDPLPPADLSAPGWHVRQGQAIWKPAGDRPELTGDLLLATNTTGDFFVQLTKNPFPLVTAEFFGEEWQIEFGAEEHSWRGRGEPPDRFIWFVLPQALLAERLPGNWRFEDVTTNSWRLTNPKTGETLEGEFFP